MKGSMRAATAIGVGYLLGRRKKLRTATLMAAATAAGGTAIGGAAVRGGMKKLGAADALGKVSPQLGEVAKTMRGDLVTAGKAAATAAVNNRVDAVADSIHQRAERVRNPLAASDGASAAKEDEPRDTGDRAEDDYDDEDQYDDEQYEDDEVADEEPGRDADDDLADEEGDAPEEDEDRGPARRRGTARRSPVTRAER